MSVSLLQQATQALSADPALQAMAGAAMGSLATGMLTLGGFWFLSKRLHRMRVLDHVRRELKGPVHDYIDWLHSLSSEFPIWRQELIPLYRGDKGRDQLELNRMRKLFVDSRSSAWFSRLEEYEVLLGKFTAVIKAMWSRQADIGERFHRVLSRIEEQPRLALEAAGQIEALAFEQAQLASDFIDHLQYECLKTFTGRALPVKSDSRKVRIIRTALGGIKLEEPMARL